MTTSRVLMLRMLWCSFKDAAGLLRSIACTCLLKPALPLAPDTRVGHPSATQSWHSSIHYF